MKKKNSPFAMKNPSIFSIKMSIVLKQQAPDITAEKKKNQ